MKLFIVLLVGPLLGITFGGRQALWWAHLHDFAKADRSLRRSALTAIAASIAACCLLFGWPWRQAEITVVDEVTRTASESVDEVIEVTKWWFFKSKETVTHEVPKEFTETLQRQATVRIFDPWLMLAMLVVGAASCFLDLTALRVVWRLRG